MVIAIQERFFFEHYGLTNHDLEIYLTAALSAGGDYAGRLSGFDTHGSDLVYLATDFGPYLLTLVPGVWWLRRAARARRAFAFGASLPVALAPFLSLTGDAYEIGSILVTRLPPWTGPAARQLLRGDDLWRRISALASATERPLWPLWLGALLAAAAGLAWALLTYGAGAGLAALAGQPALASGGEPAPWKPQPGRSTT